MNGKGSCWGALAVIVVVAVVIGLAEYGGRLETWILPPGAVLPDGGEYHGEVEDGRFHGKGTLVWPNGGRYEGQFAEGLFEGEGRIESATDDVYEGNFVDGVFHGEGTYTLASGEVYDGRFRDGRIAEGVYRDTVGNEYEGEFEGWKFHGEGRSMLAGGDVYSGTFEEGRFVGEGVHEPAAGGRYEGEFRNWQYHGTGTLIEEDGRRYIGEFTSGFRHGEGRLEDADGALVRAGDWYLGEYADGDAEQVAQRRAEAVERALYEQADLLRAALDGIAPGRPGEIDLYFVGVAPYGEQDVFRKEIDFVAQQFANEYGAAKRSVILGNHPDTLADRPMATRTSLERALAHVSSVMNPDEDILFLYLTSHGSEDHELAIEQPGLDLPDLSEAELASMVDALPAKWKIVGISACYSGGFIPGLEDENTLVMTAARADRTSFGCGEDSDMTYFGKAYFRDALPKSDSFRAAFERARELVRQWEEDDGIDQHSEPRIAMGNALAEHLEVWHRQRDR